MLYKSTKKPLHLFPTCTTWPWSQDVRASAWGLFHLKRSSHSVRLLDRVHCSIIPIHYLVKINLWNWPLTWERQGCMKSLLLFMQNQHYATEGLKREVNYILISTSIYKNNYFHTKISSAKRAELALGGILVQSATQPEKKGFILWLKRQIFCDCCFFKKTHWTFKVTIMSVLILFHRCLLFGWWLFFCLLLLVFCFGIL